MSNQPIVIIQLAEPTSDLNIEASFWSSNGLSINNSSFQLVSMGVSDVGNGPKMVSNLVIVFLMHVSTDNTVLACVLLHVSSSEITSPSR